MSSALHNAPAAAAAEVAVTEMRSDCRVRSLPSTPPSPCRQREFLPAQQDADAALIHCYHPDLDN